MLLLLNDLILDVSYFKTEHPGGSFLLDYHIGKDISKYFYGGYVLECASGMNPYMHSNVARTIVNSLAIAKLDKNTSAFTAYIVKKTSVNKDTSIFTLKVKQAGSYLAPASTNAKTMGKHYLIRSLNNSKVHRHYTASSCMK